MEIKSAVFRKGITSDDRILNDGIPQIAFVGRSNVGKSSVINSLAQRKALVKVGIKPGKTTEINFFLINNQFYLVDLPGYGFAQGNHAAKDKIRNLIIWYLTESEAMPHTVAIILDTKVGLTDLDKEMVEILQEEQHHYVIIANKCDKLTQSELALQIEKIKKDAKTSEVIQYSAKTKKGSGDLLAKLCE